MAKQTINIGSAANDGTGSTLRAAFDITNDNFTELYDGSGGLLHKIEGTNFTGSLLVGHSTTGTLSSSANNTGIGINALDALTSGDSNVAIGKSAGTSLTSGGHNIAIGHDALATEDGHGTNIAIGTNALYALNAGADAYNIAVGYNAGKLISTGVQNTIIGGLAGDALTTGFSNVAIGHAALGVEDTGAKNIAIGYYSLLNLNYDGNGYNTAVGYYTGLNITTGTNNTIIGGLAGDALTEGSNNIIIGYNAAASAVDVSNEVTIGDSNISNVRIPSDSTLKIGASGDLQLEHLSSNSFIKNTAVGDLYIENQVDDKDVIFRSDDGDGGLATYFYLDGSIAENRFSKATRHSDNIIAKFGDGNDFNIHHNTTNTYLTNATGNLEITNTQDDGDIIFKSDDGSGGVTPYLTLDGGDTRIKIPDNIITTFGDGGDLQLSHDATNSLIRNYTGDLFIDTYQDDGDIKFRSDDGTGSVTEYFRLDGGNERNIFSKSLRLLDDVQLDLGSSDDFRIVHTSANNATFIQNYTGDLQIQNNSDGDDILFRCDDGSGGLTTYFYLNGGDTNINFQKDTLHPDNVNAKFGNSADLRIYHNGTNSNIENFTGTLQIIQNLDDGDISFKSDDGSGGTTEYFRVDGGAGTIDISKNMFFGDSINAVFGGANNAWELEIYANASNDAYIKKTATSAGDLTLQNASTDGDIIFSSDDGSGGTTEYFKLDGSSKRLDIADSIPLCFGAGDDLQIQHNGSTSYIQNFTGNLIIENNLDDGDISFKSDDGSGGTATYMFLDGGNTRVTFNKNARFVDSALLELGTSGDFTMQHNATNTELVNVTGNLNIKNSATDGDISFFGDDGSGGLTTYFFLDGGSVATQFSQRALFIDNIAAEFGSSRDLKIYHDGSNSKILNTTGDLKIGVANTLAIQNNAYDENIASFTKDGAVSLYHDNSKKFETTSAGVEVTGTVDVTQSSASVPVLRLTDDGVCNYDFIFPDDSTIKLETSTSSTKTFKLLNAGSGDMNLEVSGSLSKGSGSFKIDHPVKPDTHSLYHSFVESPLTDLIYRGKAKLVKGKVSINIDEHFGMTDGTFVALVDDKQIFTTNEDTWDAVKGTVEENQLHIECQNESFEGYVSWLVIGDRKDKHIIAADWTDEKGKPILEVEK